MNTKKDMLPQTSDTKSSKKSGSKKIFVLDTSVILYNHASFYSFDDNDIAIPITVLEELDNFKKGNEIKNFEAREFIRIIDRLSHKKNLTDWVAIDNGKGGSFRVILDQPHEQKVQQIFGGYKNDHRILNAALTLKEIYPERKVILVSKDINLRIKAKALNLQAEDFETGKIKDIENLDPGKKVISHIAPQVLSKLWTTGKCSPSEIGEKEPIPNYYYIFQNASENENPTLAFYNPKSGNIERIDPQPVERIMPRNPEQAIALHAITNPNVKLVTLIGIAGTGKTLLALAGAPEQRRLYKQIYLARPIVPLSNKDIGFLPGSAEEKISPYMEPLYDNLKFIKNQYSEKEREYKLFDEMLENGKIVIAPLAFIRGRSLSNICFIVDEAQNLTPHEVKTIITRAGEGTKIIFTGDIYQIDTPYLDSQSNGLSYLVDKIHSHPIYAHVKLERGERSELANLASELL
ncbi:MAG TPA: PhoH family protein [Bacteroidales bacterium]|nr:PhoH family protein [Bacteroidales bacterium]